MANAAMKLVPTKHRESPWAKKITNRLQSTRSQNAELKAQVSDGRKIIATRSTKNFIIGALAGALDTRFDGLSIGDAQLSPSTLGALAATGAAIFTGSKMAGEVSAALSAIAGYQFGETQSAKFFFSPPTDTEPE